MAKESGRSYDFVCRFCQWCRNLVSNWNEDNNDALGGEDVVIEVDETEYGRKRKGVHGKEADTKLDVCGCLDRNSGRVILQYFEKLNSKEAEGSG